MGQKSSRSNNNNIYNNKNDSNNNINYIKTTKQALINLDHSKLTCCGMINSTATLAEYKAQYQVNSLTVLTFNKTNKYIALGFLNGSISIFETSKLEHVLNIDVGNMSFVRYMLQLKCGDLAVVYHNEIYLCHLNFNEGITPEDSPTLKLESTEKLSVFRETESLYLSFGPKSEKDSIIDIDDDSLNEEASDNESENETFERKLRFQKIVEIDLTVKMRKNNNPKKLVSEFSLYNEFYNQEKEEKKSSKIVINSKKLLIFMEKHCLLDEKGNVIEEEMSGFKDSNIIYNKYIKVSTISLDFPNFDIAQLNSEYMAGTENPENLNIYSLETYELVTQFKVTISENCDSVLHMITEDILLVCGGNILTLISISKFQVLSEISVGSGFKMTEACLLSDYNILIGMNKRTFFNGMQEEIFMQYKYINRYDAKQKKIVHEMVKIGEQFITDRQSNILIRMVDDKRMVSVSNFVDVRIIK